MLLQTDGIQRRNECAGSGSANSAARPVYLLRFAFLALTVAFWPPPIAAQTSPANANDIMLKVAANQDRAERLR